MNEPLRLKLGLCGCGNPEDIMAYIRDMLLVLKTGDWRDHEDMPYMFFVSWANYNQLAEHGTTIRCSWLTPEGEALLKEIEEALDERD